MRLICPKCTAQYEVDATMIPPGGRDVQCSACGEVWFQAPLPPATAPPPATAAADDTTSADTAIVDAATVSPDAEAVEADNRGAAADTPSGADEVPATPPPLDAAMLDLLREEAERELATRTREAAGHDGAPLEIQPDLGLTSPPAASPRPPPPATPATATMTETAAVNPPAPESITPAASAPRAGRRDLLPDIERINSSLAASTAQRASGSDQLAIPPSPRRQGFRLGFTMAMLVVALAVLGYAQTPRLAAAMPGWAPALAAYVELVDDGRRMLAQTAADLRARLAE